VWKDLVAQEQPRLRIMGRDFQFEDDKGVGWMGTWVDPSDKHRCGVGEGVGGMCEGAGTTTGAALAALLRSQVGSLIWPWGHAGATDSASTEDQWRRAVSWPCAWGLLCLLRSDPHLLSDI
jgi:hypothetical protein